MYQRCGAGRRHHPRSNDACWCSRSPATPLKSTLATDAPVWFASGALLLLVPCDSHRSSRADFTKPIFTGDVGTSGSPARPTTPDRLRYIGTRCARSTASGQPIIWRRPSTPLQTPPLAPEQGFERKSAVTAESKGAAFPEVTWQKIFTQDTFGDTALHRCFLANVSNNVCPAMKISHKLVELYLRKTPHPLLLDIPNAWGQTALHVACEQGDHLGARMLVVAGATINRPDNLRFTPLHIAASKGNVAMIRAITETIEQREVDLLDLPSYKIQLSTNHRRLPELSYICVNGFTPLHLAVLSGQVDALAALLVCADNVDTRELLEGRSPLHLAVELGRPDMVTVLLEAGANVKARDYAQRTVIRRARTQQHSCSAEPSVKDRLDECVLLLQAFSRHDLISTDEEDTDCEDEEDIENECLNVDGFD